MKKDIEKIPKLKNLTNSLVQGVEAFDGFQIGRGDLMSDGSILAAGLPQE